MIQEQKFDALPNEVLKLIFHHLPKITDMFNLAITNKKLLKAFRDLIQSSETLLVKQFSPLFLEKMVKHLDSVLELQINAAKAKQELKQELDTLIANQAITPRPSIKNILIPPIFAPHNPDLSDASHSTYRKINQITSSRLKGMKASFSPRQINFILKCFFWVFTHYLAVRKILPDNLNIKTYLPKDYSTHIIVGLWVFFLLASQFHLPEVIATLYAQKKESQLQALINQPLEDITPITPNTRQLAQHRSKFFQALKKQSDNNTMEQIEELPLEVNHLGYKQD